MIQHRTFQSRNRLRQRLFPHTLLGRFVEHAGAGRAFQQWWPRSGGIGGASAEQPPGKGGAPPVRASTWQRVRLTPRSRRGPTAGHQARQAAVVIICPSGLASHRRSRLTSNVRPRMPTRNASPALSGNAPRAQRGTSVFSACKQHRGLQEQRAASRNSVRRVQSHTAPRIRVPQCAVLLSKQAASLHRQPWLGRALTRPDGARPNHLLKRSANGMPPAPGRRYAVHFHRPGAGGIPLSPA